MMNALSLGPTSIRHNSNNRPVWGCVILGFAGLATLWAVPGWAQGPSSQRPEKSLAVCEMEPLPGLVDELQSLDRQIQESLREFETEPPKLSNVPQLNEIHAKSMQMLRVARRLAEVHEPAGFDFLARSESCLKRITKWSDQLKQDTDFSRVQLRIRKDLITEAKSREKKLGKVRNLIKQGQWIKADDALGELTDDLPAAGLWVDASLSKQALDLFQTERREINRGLSKSMQEKLSRYLDDSRLMLVPNVASLFQRIEQAVKDSRQASEVTYQGESVSGPLLVRKFFAEWEELQLQLTRHAAACNYKQQPRPLQAEQELEALSDRLPIFLQELARNGAARTENPDELRKLYVDYLQTLTPIAARLFDESRVNTLQEALSPLSNHSSVRDEIEGYRQVTDAVLAWRRRVAEAQANALSVDMDPIDIMLQRLWRESAGREDALMWFKTPGEVADPLDRLIPFLGKEAVNKLTRVRSVDASRGDNRRGSTLPRSAVLCEVSIPSVAPSILAAMRRSLFVDDQHPPLTLKAAVALWSAEHGCVEEVGGQITEISCEAIAPAWLTLTRENAAYLPATSLLTRDVRNLDKAICLKVLIQPTWIRYGALYVRLR